MDSITRITAVSVLLALLALSSGCGHGAYGARGTNYNMHMEGVFRFNILQNDVPVQQEAGQVAINR